MDWKFHSPPQKKKRERERMKGEGEGRGEGRKEELGVGDLQCL
jgi:hypothetical protein